MNLTEWARQQGVHPSTAYRWFKRGTLPVRAQRVGPRTVLILEDTAGVASGVGLYARVSSHDEKADLDGQVPRLTSWAADADWQVVGVEAEVGSGMNGSRRRVRRLLAGPDVETVVVEHRDRLGGLNVELVEAALSAHSRRRVVLDDSEVDDGLVRDMVEMLTSFCTRLYGCRGARNRAQKALNCAKADVGPGTRETEKCHSRGPGWGLMSRFEVADGWVVQAYRFALDPTAEQPRCLAASSVVAATPTIGR